MTGTLIAPDAEGAQEHPHMSRASADVIRPILEDVRRLLVMDVAVVSHFAHGRRVIDLVDASEAVGFSPGDSDPVEESYCQKIVDGVLPEVLPDTAASEAARALAATAELNIAAHLGVPILLDDGSVYGTLCTYSHRRRPDLDDRSATVLGLIADTIARTLSVDRRTWAERQAIRARLDSLLADDLLTLAYQSVVELSSGAVVAFEALSRFPDGRGGTAAQWFAEAAAVGRSVDLELAALTKVQADLPLLPPGAQVHINLTPDVLMDPTVPERLAQLPLERIVLELSEHQVVKDYDALHDVLGSLRRAGLRLAVDDAGAGFASFHNALQLKPDLLKLDIALVRDVDSDHSKRSLCQALVGFAHATQSRIVAVGVETWAEAATLRALRVDLAQGYLFARPVTLEAVPVAVEVAQPQAPPAAPEAEEPPLTRGSPVVSELLATGASPATIAAALNRAGHLTPAGRRWHGVSVRQLLL